MLYLSVVATPAVQGVLERAADQSVSACGAIFCACHPDHLQEVATNICLNAQIVAYGAFARVAAPMSTFCNFVGVGKVDGWAGLRKLNALTQSDSNLIASARVWLAFVNHLLVFRKEIERERFFTGNAS